MELRILFNFLKENKNKEKNIINKNLLVLYIKLLFT